MSESIFGELTPLEEESAEKILLKLIDEKNPYTKTEYDKPLAIARLKTMAKWLKDEKMFKSAKTLEDFIKNYSIYMISKKRQSRKEIVSVLTEMVKEERTLQQKLVSAPEER